MMISVVTNGHKLFTDVTKSLNFSYLDTTNDKTLLLVYKKMNIMIQSNQVGGEKGTNRVNVGYNTEHEWGNIGRLDRRTSDEQ